MKFEDTYKPGKVYGTKNYDQFKTVVGNRPVNIKHVNELIKEIARENLLEDFPGFVSRDGYMLDGQHRLKAAKANNLEYFFRVSLKLAKEHQIGFINSTQKKWQLDDFVHFYAENGNEQYQFIEELAKENGLTSARVIDFITSGGLKRGAKQGRLYGFRSLEEKQALSEALAAYVALKPIFAYDVWSHYKFMRAMKKLLEKVSVAEIVTQIEKYPKDFEYKRTTNEYLRQFEEIFNRYKHEDSDTYYRFF